MTAIEAPVEKDELLARVAARPSIEAMYEEWFRRYYNPLVRSLVWMGASIDEASGHVIDALTEAISRVQRGAPPPEFTRAYLLRSAQRAWAREHRRRSRERAIVLPSDEMDEIAVSLEDPADTVVASEFTDVCRRFLRPEDHKAVAMRMHGYRNDEIGHELGVSVNAVRTRLNRARRILAEHLGYSLREASQRETTAPAARNSREPLGILGEEMRRLRAESGGPTVRDIAERTGQRASYPTVHRAFQCQRLPRWAVVEAVVIALDGDVDRFWHLWADASGTPTPSAAAA